MATPISEIEETLIALLSRYAREDQVVVRETRLVADLGLESVRVLEFIVDVEDRFDVAIDIESLADVFSVAELAEVVAGLEGR